MMFDCNSEKHLNMHTHTQTFKKQYLVILYVRKKPTFSLPYYFKQRIYRICFKEKAN